MTTLMARPTQTPSVTADQMDLITRTVAQDATTDELRLYLHDCARQGVHPLDKLIHFTKRSGKYTPITSIDFMRIRAAETGEYAGSDDALFTGGDDHVGAPPAAATVTVYRLVQGQRCSFTATARWDEYKPAEDFMWRKMPHTMLAKCAEALALRKGFPRQLAGLYAKEELDQAEAPSRSVFAAPVLPAPAVAAPVVVPAPAPAPAAVPAAAPGALAGQVLSIRIFGKAKDNYAVTFSGDDREFTTKDTKLAALLEELQGTDHRVAWTFTDRVWNNTVFHNLKTVTVDPPDAAYGEQLTGADIPF